MTTDELKLRIERFLDGLVDTYYGRPTIGEKLINSSIKIIINRNIYKLDSVLCLFKDENGDIDINSIVNEYANQFEGNGVTLDIRDYVKDETIRNMLPDKALTIHREDILSIIGNM